MSDTNKNVRSVYGTQHNRYRRTREKPTPENFREKSDYKELSTCCATTSSDQLRDHMIDVNTNSKQQSVSVCITFVCEKIWTNTTREKIRKTKKNQADNFTHLSSNEQDTYARSSYTFQGHKLSLANAKMGVHEIQTRHPASNNPTHFVSFHEHRFLAISVEKIRHIRNRERRVFARV